MLDDSHTFCHPSMPRKPKSMSMLIQLSLWDGLPSLTATYVQQLLFWSHWHFFITEGAEGLQQLHHTDVLSRDTL